MDPIVIATGNPHKVDELRAIFAECGLPVIGLMELPGGASLREPQESGRTFEQNAAIKARRYAAQTGRIRRIFSGLLGTMTLGAVFLVIKAFEYHHKYVDGLIPGVKKASW